jgi:hypothetical protein
MQDQTFYPVPFRRYKDYPETAVFGNLFSDRSKICVGRGNRSRWVEWWYLLFILKWSNTSIASFQNIDYLDLILKKYQMSKTCYTSVRSLQNEKQISSLDSAWPITPSYTNFGAIEEQIAKNGCLRIILICPERNKVERSALHRSIENTIC